MNVPSWLRPMPPARFWLAIVMLAVEVRFFEKPNAISGGGVAGISIALAHFTGLTVGSISLVFKVGVLLLVWRIGGRMLAGWTAVAAVLSSLLLWALELIPFHGLPVWVAFPIILVFTNMPSSLLLSCGYSSGGFSSLAQLFEGAGIAPGLTTSALNALSLLMMFLAFGGLSGVLSLVTTLAAGLGTQFWVTVFRRRLPATAVGARDPQGEGT